MSRILYVEDKLEQYKDMILEMFEPILTISGHRVWQKKTPSLAKHLL